MHPTAEIADEHSPDDPPAPCVAEISSLVQQADRRPYSTILRLALPVFAEQALIFGVDLTDAYLSGRISEAATEAICVAGYIGWMATVVFGLIGIGTTALVARAWGAGRRDDACRIAGRSLMLAPCLALPLFLLLQVLAPYVAEFLNLRGEAFPIAVEYLRYDAFGHVCTSLMMIAGASLRGSGDMRTPMLVLMVVNVINVAVSTSAVFGWGPFPRLEVFGIVAGTVTAKVIGAALMLSVVTGGWSHLRVRFADIKFDSEITRRLLRIGGPACLDGLITVTGHLMFLRVISLVKDYQPGALAAHLVGVRVEAVSYLPATAWGIAAASLVGQSLGAHRPDLAVRIGHAAAKQSFCYATVVGVIMFLAANQVFGVMHTDPRVIAAGVPALRTLAFYSVPNAALIVYVNCLRGAGDTRFPLLFATIGVWLVRVPVAYYFGYLHQGGLVGAWIGMGSDLCLRSVLMYWRFSAASWTRIKV